MRAKTGHRMRTTRTTPREHQKTRSSTRWTRRRGTFTHSQILPRSCVPWRTSAPWNNKSSTTTTFPPTTWRIGIANHGPGRTILPHQECQSTRATSFLVPCSSRSATLSAWSRPSTRTGRPISTSRDPTDRRHGTATNARDTRSYRAPAKAGMARKLGHCQGITNMSDQNVQPAECFRIVIEVLMNDEKGHQVSLDTGISDDACELMGDVLEAAGGLIDPLDASG